VTDVRETARSGPQPAVGGQGPADGTRLMTLVDRVRGALRALLGEDETDISPDIAADRGAVCAPIDAIVDIVGLSAFERDVLVLCAAAEIDAETSDLCARAQDGRRVVTPDLALAALPGGHWSALSPDGPLRRWDLLRWDGSQGLLRAALSLDERLLLFLLGVSSTDPELAGVIERCPPQARLSPALDVLAGDITQRWWSGGRARPDLPVVQLVGPGSGRNRALASRVCARLGLGLQVISTSALPAAGGELRALGRRWDREALLEGSALLVEGDEIDRDDPARRASLRQFLTCCRSPLLVAGPVRQPSLRPAVLTWDVPPQSWPDRRESLDGLLTSTPEDAAFLDRVCDQFDLDADDVAAVRTAAPAPQAPDAREVLWRICRSQARMDVEDIADRITPSARLDDLVLPAEQAAAVGAVAAHVRHQAQVRQRWGFATQGSRGPGVAALFSGPSGTGKSFAAEAVAGELGLDLLRVDLSRVVSKYVGETEKLLRRVFAAGERGDAVLLFDEADALFGKRSQVHSSHDRHANIEVSYLLQRLDSYRGAAVLTTNLADAVDTAFSRRLQFVVAFPFPDVAERAVLWRRAFPPTAPTVGLDPQRLARLAVPGGTIRTIAVNAAYAAAEEGTAIGMPHLLEAARRELGKLGRPDTATELRGWACTSN
jgi:ATPase family associated with various cellular activities (AAA)